MKKSFGYGSAVAFSALLAGCAQFPELDRTQTPGVATAPYPRLLPIEELLDGRQPTATPGMIDGVLGRADALRGRAGTVQAAPVGQGAGVQDRLTRLRRKAEALREAEL